MGKCSDNNFLIFKGQLASMPTIAYGRKKCVLEGKYVVRENQRESVRSDFDLNDLESEW